MPLKLARKPEEALLFHLSPEAIARLHEAGDGLTFAVQVTSVSRRAQKAYLAVHAPPCVQVERDEVTRRKARAAREQREAAVQEATT